MSIYIYAQMTVERSTAIIRENLVPNERRFESVELALQNIFDDVVRNVKRKNILARDDKLLFRLADICKSKREETITALSM